MYSDSPTVIYFGTKVVEAAITAYFAAYGLSREVRNDLMIMASNKEDDFFEMVSNYIENNA